MGDKYVVGIFFVASLFLFVAHVDAAPIEMIEEVVDQVLVESSRE